MGNKDQKKAIIKFYLLFINHQLHKDPKNKKLSFAESGILTLCSLNFILLNIFNILLNYCNKFCNINSIP